MKATVKKSTLKLGVPTAACGDGFDIVTINATLLNILRKKKMADFTTYGLPTQLDDVFSRKIRLVKMLKKEALGFIDDIPDLDDVHNTNLPWIGQATFNSATRQFRSKNVLACAVEVIREVDGYLYRLSVSVNPEPVAPTPLVLVYLDMAKKAERNHVLTVDKDVTEDQYQMYLIDAAAIPAALVTELGELGYTHTGNVFSQGANAQIGSNIRCELYGKVLLAS